MTPLDHNYLVMKIVGWNSSWGQPGRKDERTTFVFPAKSAIVGMIGNGLGLHYDDPEMIEKVATLSKVKMSVFIAWYDGIYTDFQTAKDKTANSKKENVVLHKEYLTGSKYVVLVSGNPQTIALYEKAILRPVRPLYLGRAVCHPTQRIYVGSFQSEEEANNCLDKTIFELYDGAVEKRFANATKPDSIIIRMVSDADNIQEANDWLLDHPVQFGVTHNSHRIRAVKDCEVEVHRP